MSQIGNGLALSMAVLLGGKMASNKTFSFNDLPSVGEAKGMAIRLGGFSGLIVESRDESRGKIVFRTHTDRGPNGSAFEKKKIQMRPFALPHFHPQFVRFELDLNSSSLKVIEQIPLKLPDGTLALGLPPPNPSGAAQRYEVPVDFDEKPLKSEPRGIDPEGLTRTSNGDLWMCEEYGPSIFQVAADGRILKQIGPEQLPPIFAQRAMNKGFEAITAQGKMLFVFLENFPLADFKQINRSLVLKYDTANARVAGIYAYEFSDDGAEKVSDAATSPKGEIWVVEQNGKSSDHSIHKIYSLDFSNAENLIEGAITPERIAKARTVTKKLEVNLTDLGYHPSKVEGLAFIDAHTIAVVNDDDFGMGKNPDETELLVIRLPD